MTTIAVNLHAMAADSMVSDEMGTDVRVDKLVAVGSGAIVGCAGELGLASMFLDYFENMGKMKRPRFKVDAEFDALVLTRDGIFHFDRTCRAREVTEGFCAIGSGSQAAMCFMRSQRKRGHRINPIAAVEFACLGDKGSALPVRVITLASLKRKG
jgi:20S proteasome alpha/beta subunit